MNDAYPVYRIIAVRAAQASVIALTAHWLLHWPLSGPHALGLFLIPAISLYFVFVFVARWSWGLPILTCLAKTERMIALTFDDGPSPETTPQILETLRASRLCATFFVLGEAVDRSPDLLRQIVADGHTVGIHGYRHRPFVLLSLREIKREIRQTQEAIEHACPGSAPSLWVRPPHGFKTPAALWAIRRAGCRFAAWSLDSRDYRDDDPHCIAQNVISHLQPGAVVLLHDGPNNALTAQALPAILSSLDDQGWEMAVLPPF